MGCREWGTELTDWALDELSRRRRAKSNSISNSVRSVLARPMVCVDCGRR